MRTNSSRVAMLIRPMPAPAVSHWQGTNQVRQQTAIRLQLRRGNAGVCACGLHRSRYVGLAKTHMHHVATAAALNVVRLSAWVRGEARAATRTSRLVRLMAA